MPKNIHLYRIFRGTFSDGLRCIFCIDMPHVGIIYDVYLHDIIHYSPCEKLQDIYSSKSKTFPKDIVFSRFLTAKNTIKKRAKTGI